MLEQHVHEHVHRFGFDHQRTCRTRVVRIEVLVHAIVVNHSNVTSLPVIANAIVNFIARAIQNVKRRFVDVAVFL